MNHLKLLVRPTVGSRLMSSRLSTKDMDTFGTLSDRGRKTLAVNMAERFVADDADGYDKEEYDIVPKKNHYYYKYEITKHARTGAIGLRRALELFHEMKSVARLSPEYGNLSALIYGCGRAGYTEKAFELYKELLKYHTKPSFSVVNSMISACALSPFQEYALERLDWLLNHVKIDLHYKLNRIQFRCAIHAYGRLGRMDKASDMLKEMIEAGFDPDRETFNRLIAGCVHNKNSGTTIALRIFKRMRLYGIKPNLNTYINLVRCIQSCGVGSREIVEETIKELPTMTVFNQRLMYKKISQRMRQNNQSGTDDKWSEFEWLQPITDLSESIKLAVEDGSSAQNSLISTSHDAQVESRLIPVSYTNSIPAVSSLELPNLLSDNHLKLLHQIRAIQHDKLNSPRNRLMMFGGMHGVLDSMTKDKVQPDIKIFCLLIDCMTRSKEHQIELFRLTEDYKVERNLVFYNLLIKNICITPNEPADLRMQRALALIDEMQKDNIRPDVSTFEALAVGCVDTAMAKQMITHIQNCNFVISDLMMKRLFDQASRSSTLEYAIYLIEVSISNKYSPSAFLVDKLESMRLNAHDEVLRLENNIGQQLDEGGVASRKKVMQYDKFSSLLATWLKSVPLRSENDPWNQFEIKGGESKRQGLNEFINQFKALNSVKKTSMQNGGRLGNLTRRANLLVKQGHRDNPDPRVHLIN